MNVHLVPILLTGIVFFTVAYIIETILKYRLRSRIVASGLTDERFIKGLFSSRADNKASSLKWGLILLFAGIGLIVLEYVPYEYDSPLPYGIEGTFIALGFLIYFFIVNGKRIRQTHTEHSSTERDF
ncbi:hypothetical protein JHJ32_13200 [Parapedobacter sp. ISTM3]|uniref:DUF6249 domain-containing protein n=1 Tax=Parapedobacter luteus TaxID=623280 RepID=A0A1T5DM18_9SPHI|nr:MULTISPECIES: DUF6249 domain-containing protein [Parapedobacter]MBK1440950.1 hypothetical protein [Parapedobacter sp. ISTM3]SKB72737.1 hypothetical protein SAMN05660226_02831 [Parapedobacter luteus]